MSRASTVITLVLLGSALALIGWSCYQAFEDPQYGQGSYSHGGYYGGSHIWFWGGGGGSSVGSAPSSSGTVHGGFGSTGHSAGVGA